MTHHTNGHFPGNNTAGLGLIARSGSAPAKKLLTIGTKQAATANLEGAGFTTFSSWPCKIPANKGWGEEDVMVASSLQKASGPVQESPVIDEAHLGRMTLGDRVLEREILEIFVRQAAIMLDRIAGAAPALAAASAHTLKGSARGIGAWRVAQAAERLECAATDESSAAERDEAVEDLKAATLEACAAIGARLCGTLHAH
jgi:HPt (histidine-containing phosphotransfer) domain-containing protein